MSRRKWLWTALTLGAALTVTPALAQKKYDPGASDTEIKVGNMNPYSGPASAYGLIGKTIGAYFKKVNAEGGINGRKVNYISYDDAYSPPKAVEQARKQNAKVLIVARAHSDEEETHLKTLGADVVILGCAGLGNYRHALQESLGIPVIDPVQAGVALASTNLDLDYRKAAR